jgi:hypothetical protein
MIHLEEYLPHVGSGFEVRYPDGSVIPLMLAEARDLGSTAQQEQFTITFQGPAQPFLPQGTYGLIHGGLGEMALFLVPIAQSPEGYLYQAVFNRLIQA